jgi:ATP-dependent Clp protease ATP-binding subunit ClpX
MFSYRINYIPILFLAIFWSQSKIEAKQKRGYMTPAMHSGDVSHSFLSSLYKQSQEETLLGGQDLTLQNFNDLPLTSRRIDLERAHAEYGGVLLLNKRALNKRKIYIHFPSCTNTDQKSEQKIKRLRTTHTIVSHSPTHAPDILGNARSPVQQRILPHDHYKRMVVDGVEAQEIDHTFLTTLLGNLTDNGRLEIHLTDQVPREVYLPRDEIWIKIPIAVALAQLGFCNITVNPRSIITYKKTRYNTKKDKFSYKKLLQWGERILALIFLLRVVGVPELIDQMIPRRWSPPPFKNAKAIYGELSALVKGQDGACKMMAKLMDQHARYNKEESQVPNVALELGDSGSGKTWLTKKAAEASGYPFLIFNTPHLVSSGIKGNTISDGFRKAIDIYGKKGVERAVIFFDEFDKKCKKQNNNNTTVDMNKALFDELLTIFSGNGIDITYTNPLGVYSTIHLDTSGMTFILAGVFEELKSPQKKVTATDLTNNTSMGRELSGRINLIERLNPLNQEVLQDILNLKGGHLDRYVRDFAGKGVTLTFAPDAIEEIARQALERKEFGARSLTSILAIVMEKLQDQVYFASSNNSGKSIHVTAKQINKSL